MKRIIEIPGAINLRDFGGYETTDGRRVRSGVLFRSGMLAGLTSDGKSALRDLGIGVICDLRRDEERNLDPTPFPIHDPRQVHVSIDPDHGVKLREEMQRDGLDLVAAILFALGVPREVVIDDYLLTNEAMDFERFIVPRLREAHGDNYGQIDVEAAKALSGVRLEYIHAALDEVDANHGSFDTYLERALGINAARRAALQDRYLE
jgi:protein-tyrosine phosphatase